MRSTLVIAGSDLRRRLRDKSVLIQGVIGPLVLAAIISFAFGGFDTFTVEVVLVDQDHTMTSAAIVEGLEKGVNEGDGEGLRIRVMDSVSEARRLVEDNDNDVDGLIVLPSGFCDSLAGDPLPIETVVNEGSSISGDVTESLARGIAGRVDLTRVSINTAIRVAADEGEIDKVAGVVSDGCGSADAEGAASGASDDGTEIEAAIAVVDQSFSGDYNAASYYAPGMAILFAFFAMGIGARSILRERDEGTLVRVRAAPLTDRTILFAKTIGVVVLGFLSIVIVWVVTSLALSANWGPPWGAILVIVCLVFSIAGLSMLVTALARTEPQADGYTAMLAFVLALVGGTFVSPAGLPGVLKAVSAFTPNGLALRAFTDLSLADAGLIAILPYLGGLLAIGLISGAIALVIMQRRVLA